MLHGFKRHNSLSIPVLAIISGFILTNVVWIVWDRSQYSLPSDRQPVLQNFNFKQHSHNSGDSYLGEKVSEQRWNDISASKYHGVCFLFRCQIIEL